MAFCYFPGFLLSQGSLSLDQKKKKAYYISCVVCITEFIWLGKKDKKVYIKKMMKKIRRGKKERKKGKDQVRNRKRQRVCLFVNLNCAFVDDIII